MSYRSFLSAKEDTYLIFSCDVLISSPVTLHNARALEIQFNWCLYIRIEVLLVGFIGLPYMSDFLYTVSAEELFLQQENEKGEKKQQELWLPRYCTVWNDLGMTEAFLD